MQTERAVEMKSGVRDKIEGPAKSLAANGSEATGQTFGNPRLEAQGDFDQF
jgi:uncharacterized protein YjbJ (UPF0337 family)